MKQKAIFVALSDKVRNNNFLIVDKLQMTEFSTKSFNVQLEKLEARFAEKETKSKQRKLLLIVPSVEEKVKKSADNIPGVVILNLENINLIDLLKNNNLIMTMEAINSIEKQYIKK